MKTIEDVSSTADEESETSKSINSILQTLSLFTDNVDSTIDQLISKVKESADVEIQESTTNFDSFVQDLMEILENVYISLRKLTMSKTQDLYKQLEAISSNITSQTDDLNIIENKLTELNITKKRDSEDLALFTKRLDEFNKKISEASETISKSEEEITQRNYQINEKEKENYTDDIKKLKDLKSQYWENVEIIQGKIDSKQKELEQLQINFQELQGIQSLFDNIIEIETNIEDLKQFINWEIEQLINKIKSSKCDCWRKPCCNRKKTMVNKLLELQDLFKSDKFDCAFKKLLHDIKPKLTGLKTDQNEEPWANGVFNNPWIICDQLKEEFRIACNNILSHIKTFIC